MKNLFIGIIILILSSCSTTPKIAIERNLGEQLIEKPKINYKLKSLPKDINVIYFSNSLTNNAFPDEVKGLLTNYYSFSIHNKYFPNIRFIDLNKTDTCPLTFERDSFNFIFLLKNSLENESYDLCLSRLINRDNLLVSDLDNEFMPKNFRTFLVNRNKDKLELIRFMSSYSNNIMVIDNDITNDKYEIGKIWENRFNKKIAEYKTFADKESGQDIFSDLLLSNQSIKRKRKLSRIISSDLDHKPRPRQDIDTLFLSVSTQEARGLKPALDYNYFQGMEVYLANDWQGDIEFQKTDKDLEGVISIDFPFMLQTQIPEELNGTSIRTRNFAIGYDSFEIALLLKGTRNLNKPTYKGLTGTITLNDKTIERKSLIFRVKDGSFEYLN